MNVRKTRWSEILLRWARTLLSAYVIIGLALGVCPHVSPGVGPPSSSVPGDWRTIELAEAFPNALAELENPRALTGGVSGTGTGNKGSFAVNGKGGMAITFVQGTGATGDVILGRSLDAGKTWRKHKLTDIGMRNSWTINPVATVTLPLAGPGPEVEITEKGDVVFACLSGNELLSFIWHVDEQDLKKMGSLQGDVPTVNRCGFTVVDRQVEWFRLYRIGGAIYLVTNPSESSSAGVSVYCLNGKQWDRLGASHPAQEGSLGQDTATGEIYLGLEMKRKNAGEYPAVLRWDPRARKWQEIVNTDGENGLREQYGVTSYPGAQGAPAVTAYKGTVYAFWWQDSEWLQGAVYKQGKWVSCGRATVMDEHWEPLECESSFGQGQGIYRQHRGIRDLSDTKGLEAVVDSKSGDVLVLAADGTLPLVIHEGRVTQSLFGRRTPEGRLVPDMLRPRSLYAPAGTPSGGFDTVQHTNSMWFATMRLKLLPDAAYLLATLYCSGSGSNNDVFVFKLLPHPHRDMGVEWDRYPSAEVKSVAKGSPAEVAGLKAGDIILWVGQKKDAGSPNLTKVECTWQVRFSDKDTVQMGVRRGNQNLILDVRFTPAK